MKNSLRTRHFDKTKTAWKAMIGRCCNPNDVSYSNYGGRGITVCDRWKSFDNFLYDMGEAPSGLELDRINNAEGYYPLNCRWISRKENSRNRRSTKLSYVKVRLIKGLLRATNPRVSLKKACEVYAPLFGVTWMSLYNVATGITWAE